MWESQWPQDSPDKMENKEAVRADLGVGGHLKLALDDKGLENGGFQVAGHHLMHICALLGRDIVPCQVQT